MLRRSIILVFTTTCLGAAVTASGCGVNPAFDCTNRNISCVGDDAGLTTHSDAQTSDTALNDAAPNGTCCDASGEDAPAVIPPDGTDAATCSGSDPDHCGASCLQCSGPPSGNGNAVCSAGTCGITCAGNYFLCNGDCHSLSADPSDACVVADSIGVFVAPAGQDAAGKGTRAAPFATIGYAVQHLNGHPRVYVQAGTYVGVVSIGATASAVIIFGGFDSTWNYDPAHQSVKVQAPAGSAALSISGATASLTVANIEFDSVDAQGNGGSSIAAQVNASSGSIAFAHCAFSAGKGTPGTSGATPPGPLPTPATGNAADTGTNNGGPTTKECKCPFGVSSYGGQGGAGGATPTDGANGQPQLSSNKGTAGSLGIACGGGTKGADAPAVAADGPGATTSGAIASSTWEPAAGTKGTGGGSGQGGGGGGGTYNALPTSSGNGGSGGGCGGCGGGGGGAGGGGGGSVGVLVVQASSVSFTECSVKTAGGGNGGAGAGGELGTPGAGPGTSTNGCPGAGGGAGGKGGAGGGGAGGISVGILWQGTVAPSVDSTTQSAIVVGQAGSLGKGGNSPSNDGIKGSSAPVLQMP